MATSSPASRIVDQRVLIPAASTTNTPPNIPSAPVLATVPDPNPSSLQQAADHLGQQNPPPVTSQPSWVGADDRTPAFSTNVNATRNSFPPGSGSKSASAGNKRVLNHRLLEPVGRPIDIRVPPDADEAGIQRAYELGLEHADDPEGAIEYYFEVLVANQKALGIGHPDTARSHADLASVYEGIGNREQALKHYLKALVISESVLGSDHAGIAELCESVRKLLRAPEEHENAEEYLQNALDITERTLGCEHTLAAEAQHNMGSMLTKNGKHKKAMNCYLKARCIEETIYGADHPSIAATNRNIAALLKAQGKGDQAMAYMAAASASLSAGKRADAAT
ncbi:tetratricopeptide repeat protein [Noviherbaspirillum sp. 1P10PC]|uniref:tetratricopeptide repeat protein n=1 Tax=Noviherbaspirillum sp. 1P10PC TaxID=3132292 RepID=UPI00399EF1DE